MNSNESHAAVDIVTREYERSRRRSVQRHNDVLIERAKQPFPTPEQMVAAAIIVAMGVSFLLAIKSITGL